MSNAIKRALTDRIVGEYLSKGGTFCCWQIMPTGTGHNISIEIVDSSLKRLNQLQVDFVTQWQKHFFGSLPMTAKYSWAGANETRFNVFIYKEDEIVSRLRIISRKARVDSAEIQVAVSVAS